MLTPSSSKVAGLSPRAGVSPHVRCTLQVKLHAVPIDLQFLHAEQHSNDPGVPGFDATICAIIASWCDFLAFEEWGGTIGRSDKGRQERTHPSSFPSCPQDEV
jgi:hypothetical protein